MPRLILNKKFIEGVIQKVVFPMMDLVAWRVDPFESSSSDGLQGEAKCFAPCGIEPTGPPCLLM